MSKPKPNLSVCLLALNEERYIEKTLQSVQGLTDEIIVVVDDRTTDSTAAIAKKFSSQVITQKHQDHFHINKQFAIEQATGEWILWLDADEEVTLELKEEIKKIISNPSSWSEDLAESPVEAIEPVLSLSKESPQATDNLRDPIGRGVYPVQGHGAPSRMTEALVGFFIPRKNILFGKWIEHTGWYPDYQLRLFKNGSVSFPCKRIHEDPEIKGETAKLNHSLIHYNYESISHFIQKLNKYTDVDAQGYVAKLTHPYGYHLINRFLDEFIKRFLALEGYKDGLHGLILSLLQSFYELVVVAKAIELKKFEEKESGDLIQLIEEEAKSKMRDWKWWKYEMDILQTKNKFVKIIYKLLRKALMFNVIIK